MASPAKSHKIPRYLGITYLAVAALFLFDPYIAIFDLLPDAVGYLFLYLGCRRLSDMDDRLGEVSRAAAKLVLLGIARLFAILLTYTPSLVSHTERPMFILLMLFTLGVLDLLVVIPMWRHFAGGMTYLGTRTDATALFDRTARDGHTHLKNRCERYVGFTTFYFVLREVLAVLPEMTVLTHEQGGTAWGYDSLYNFVGFFRLAGCTISLILGIIWLITTFLFIGKIKSDKPFFDSLHHKYKTEVLSRHDLFAMRAIKASLIALSVSAILSLDFYIEGVSVLPDFLAAIAMILSIRFLSGYTPKGKRRAAMAVSVLYGCFAVVSWVLQITYLSFNDLPDVLHKPALETRMRTVTLIQGITSILFLGAFLLILRLLYSLVRHHTGLRALHEGSGYAAERTGAIHIHIRRKLIWVGIFAGVSAISSVLLWGGIPTLEPIHLPIRPATGEALMIMLYDLLREAYWTIDLILGGGLVALTIHASSEIFEQMDYTYLMN